MNESAVKCVPPVALRWSRITEFLAFMRSCMLAESMHLWPFMCSSSSNFISLLGVARKNFLNSFQGKKCPLEDKSFVEWSRNLLEF